MANEKTNGNGKSKYEQTINKATGATGDGGVVEDAALLPKEAQAMFSVPSDAEIQSMLNDPGLEFAPQIKKLAEGEMVQGFLEGYGPVAVLEKVDRMTKEVKQQHVNTWIIASPNRSMRVSILSSVQLERKLAPFIGGMVKIIRGKEQETQGGNRVTDYLVSGPKLIDGKFRTFAHPTKVIEATGVDVMPQLVAGTIPGGEDARA